MLAAEVNFCELQSDKIWRNWSVWVPAMEKKQVVVLVYQVSSRKTYYQLPWTDNSFFEMK